jgi:glucose uptake protein
VLNDKSYQKLSIIKQKPSMRGILLSVLGGLFIAFFYGFVVKSLDSSYVDGGTGTLTPYSAIFFFSLGVILCTILFFLFIMRPLKIGVPGSFKEYFSASAKTHLAGMLGGIIWCAGMVFSFMAVGSANPTIAYALSNAAPVVAMLWGIFVWNEFKGADITTIKLLFAMFLLYIMGLALVTLSNN